MTNKRELGGWLRSELVEMGPAFIKLGQFLSTRVDIFGKDITAELCRLQDDIEPIDYNEISEAIQHSIAPLSDSTLQEIVIDPVPIASASIGQVHRGRIIRKRSTKLKKRDRLTNEYKNNEENVENVENVEDDSPIDIVIKVQKPGVGDRMRADIATIKRLLAIVEPFNMQQAKEMSGIISQYDSFLEDELDYIKELNNMKKFDRLFEGIHWVKVPGVIDSLSSQNVLVMEWIPSTKITDLATFNRLGIDTKRLAHNLMQTFIQMILFYGEVHCDPHPGNLGVGADGDTIVLYDFGNVVKLDKGFYEKMQQLLMAFYKQDPDEFLAAVIKLKIITITNNTVPQELNDLFTSFFRYLDNPDFSKLRTSIAAIDIGGINKGDVTFRVDQNLLSLFRVFSLLDGTCVLLDPEFSYVDVITPFAADLMRNGNNMTLFSQIAKEFGELRSFPKMIKQTDRAVNTINQRVKTVSRDIERFGYVAIALLVIQVIQTVQTANVTLALFAIPLIIWWLVSSAKN